MKTQFKKIILIPGLITLGLFLNACSASVSVEPLVPLPSLSEIFTKMGSSSEFVSASTTPQLTALNQYSVIASVGSPSRDLVVTTPNGYKVYQTVQGTMISGDDQGNQ